MASNMKTSNLNLSQFEDTDSPSWLTDYNNDMLKIDSKTMPKAAYDANGDVETAGGIAAFAMPKTTYDANGEVQSAGGIAAYTNSLVSNKAADVVLNTPIKWVSGVSKPAWVTTTPSVRQWGKVGQIVIATGINAGYTENASNIVCTLPQDMSGTGTFLARVNGNVTLGSVNGRDVYVYLPPNSVDMHASVTYFITP